MVLKPGPPRGANREQTLHPLPVSESPGLGLGGPVGSAVSPASVGALFRCPYPSWPRSAGLLLGRTPSPSPLLLCSVQRNTSPTPERERCTRRVFIHSTNQVSKHWRPWFFTLCSLPAPSVVWRCCPGADPRDQPPLGAEAGSRASRVSVGGGSTLLTGHVRLPR